MRTDQIVESPATEQEVRHPTEHLNGAGRARIISLEFDEAANADCEDSRYGCTCINYEKCCGCLLQ